MNQMLDIAGSYVVGGLIILSVIGLTLHFTNVSQETRIAEINQRSLTDIGQIVEHDIFRLGYRVESGNKITSINANNIVFLSDIDNNGVVDTINYSENKEKDETYFVRKISNTTSSQWKTLIEDLVVEGFDSTGTVTYTINNIKSIAITIALVGESTTTQEIAGQVWKRHFFPKNL